MNSRKLLGIQRRRERLMEEEAIARFAISPEAISKNPKCRNRQRKRITIKEDLVQFGPGNHSWDPVHGNASNITTEKLQTDVT
jgi:hypothetical protein